ncbi:hypothetical protein ACOMHN_032162 [Nucella lapillus]
MTTERRDCVMEFNTKARWRIVLTFNYKPAVSNYRCGDQEMECSPVQCVSSGAVCDGQRDCTNGRDEYCYHLNDIGELDSPQTQLPLPPKDTACFLCRDGTCILPRLPRYDYRWGVWLWYLCDGVPHCPDGWDEQPYMCYLSRHFPQLAQRHLFQCEAYTQAPQEGSPQGESPQTPPPFSRQVRMWSLARCDDRRDCRLPEEEGKERCENMLGVSSRSDRIQEPSATRRRIRSILRTGSGRRDDDDGGGGGGSEEDRDDSTNSSDAALECSSVLQTGCLSVRSILVIADKATLSHHDFERLRETTV